MCVTVSAEQEHLDFSEDTVSNLSSFTSFEQDSVNTVVRVKLLLEINMF